MFCFPLDENSKAVYTHFEVSICSEVPTTPTSTVSKLWWFPHYKRKSFKGLTSLKYVTQLNMILFLQSMV